MCLENFWHPRFNWYGPAGIGAMRGIDGFRRDHQIPFLNAVPDRRGGYDGEAYFFADKQYVGETAWPGMMMTYTGDGFLGIAPSDKSITMRSLDFWRIEDGIRWVLMSWLVCSRNCPRQQSQGAVLNWSNTRTTLPPYPPPNLIACTISGGS